MYSVQLDTEYNLGRTRMVEACFQSEVAVPYPPTNGGQT